MSQPNVIVTYRVDRSKIPRVPAARNLYSLERDLQDAVLTCAKELLKVKGLDQTNLWMIGVPSELYSILDGFEKKAAEAAAVKFLEDRGYFLASGLEELKLLDHAIMEYANVSDMSELFVKVQNRLSWQYAKAKEVPP